MNGPVKRCFSVFNILVLGIILSQCDKGLENPNYPFEPSITFKSIEFIEVLGAGTNDSLKFVIKYRDGDSDLGIDWDDPVYSNDPYHTSYYFLEDGSGDTTKVSTKLVYAFQGIPYTLLNSGGKNGKLVTNRTRNKAGYDYLPTYIPNNCEFYSEDRILVPEAAADASYNILDTLYGSGIKFFLIQEPLLYLNNENHYNISVEFHISDDGVNFTAFNWLKYCYNYDGIFPPLLNTGTFKSGPFKIKVKTPWEGEISYSMPNPSFYALLSSKKIKLKIKIKDRILHTSNVIETPVFTLDEIRKN